MKHGSMMFLGSAMVLAGAVGSAKPADAASAYVAIVGNSVTGKMGNYVGTSQARAQKLALDRCKDWSSKASAPYCTVIKTCGSGWYASVKIFHGHGYGFGATCGHGSREKALQQARNVCNRAHGGGKCQYDAKKL